MKARLCLLAYLVCYLCAIVEAQHRGSHRYGQTGDRSSEDDESPGREGHTQDHNFRLKTERETPRSSQSYSSRESPQPASQRSNRVTAEAFERSFSTDYNSRRFTPRPTPLSSDRSPQTDRSLRNSRLNNRNFETTQRSSYGNDELSTRRSSRFRVENSEPIQRISSQRNSDEISYTKRQDLASSRNSRLNTSEKEVNNAQNNVPQSLRHSSRILGDSKNEEEIISPRNNRRNYQISSRNIETQEKNVSPSDDKRHKEISSRNQPTFRQNNHDSKNQFSEQKLNPKDRNNGADNLEQQITENYSRINENQQNVNNLRKNNERLFSRANFRNRNPEPSETKNNVHSRNFQRNSPNDNNKSEEQSKNIDLLENKEETVSEQSQPVNNAQLLTLRRNINRHSSKSDLQNNDETGNKKNLKFEERENDQSTATSQSLNSRRLKTDDSKNNLHQSNPLKNLRQSRFRERVNEDVKSKDVANENNGELQNDKKKDRFTKPDFKRRNKENIPSRTVDINEQSNSTPLNLQDQKEQKNNLNKDFKTDSLLTTAETIISRQKNYKENLPVTESKNTPDDKINEAQLLSSRNRFKDRKTLTKNDENSDKLFTTAETITRSHKNVNNPVEKQSEIKELPVEKENILKRKLNNRQKVTSNSKESDLQTQDVNNNDRSKESTNLPLRGTKTHKKNPNDEGISGEQTKKNKSEATDDGIGEDDNYPIEYKQLKKAGNGPKEILEVLKARKAQREAAQRSVELHPGQQSVQASLLGVRPQIYQQATRQVSEDETISKSNHRGENRFERNRNLGEKVERLFSSPGARLPAPSYQVKEPESEDEPIGSFPSGRGQNFNNRPRPQNVFKPMPPVSVRDKVQEQTVNDPEKETKPKRAYTRRDEQNKAIKEFKIKPTPEVETERPRFIPTVRRPGVGTVSSKEDSTVVDSENEEVRVPGKLKYHLYEPSSRKKHVTQQSKPESTTKPAKATEEVKTVTKSYSKLARYPKLATTSELATSTEGSLAARLNARRLRQQHSTTAEVPETLPPVTIVYANSISTSKPLESDSLVLEESTMTSSVGTTASTTVSTTVSPSTPSPGSNAWATEVAQPESTSSTTADTPSTATAGTFASAMNRTTTKPLAIMTTTPMTVIAESSTINTTTIKPTVHTQANKQNKVTTQKPPVSTVPKTKQSKPKNNNRNKTTTKSPPTVKTTKKPTQTNEIIKTSETKQFANENLTVNNNSTTMKPTTKTLLTSPSNNIIDTTTKKTLTSQTIPVNTTMKPTQKPQTSSPRNIVESTTNKISTTQTNPVSTTTTTTKSSPLTLTTLSTTKKPKPKQKTTTKTTQTTTKPQTITTTKVNSKRQSEKDKSNNTSAVKPTVTPIPVFINNTLNMTNLSLLSAGALINNSSSVTTNNPITTSPITITITTPKITTTVTDKSKKPEQKPSKKVTNGSQSIKNTKRLTIAQDRIDDSTELEESSADFVVYGLLPNKSLVRRVPSPTPRTELPFVVYGLYPNGTIVRRFPNGTIIPDDPQETNELVADTVDPSDKSAISQLLQRDQPTTRTTTTTTTSTLAPQTIAMLPTVPSTRTSDDESTTAQQQSTIAISSSSTTTTTTSTTTTTTTTTTTPPPPPPTTVMTTTTTTTKKPTTTLATTTTKKPATTTTTTTKKPVTQKPTTTTKKPKQKSSSSTTRKPNASTSKPKTNNKQSSGKSSSSKKPKQPQTTQSTTTITTTTIRPTTPAAVQSATRIAEDFALLNSLLMRKLPEENINANSIAPELMSSTPAMDSDDLANRIIQLAIERAGPGSSPPTPASALVTLAGTQASNLQDLTANSNSFSPSTSPQTSTPSPDNSVASTKPGGKISVWVVPEEEMSSADKEKTTPTVPKLTPQEEQVLSALLSTPSPTQDQLLLAELLSGNPAAAAMTNSTTKKQQRKPKTSTSTSTTTTTTQRTLLPSLTSIFSGQRTRGGGGGFLRSLGSNTNEADSEDSNEETAETQTPPRPIISAAINMSRAVSQFMGLVIQDAVEQLQVYLEERLKGLMLTNTNNTITVVDTVNNNTSIFTGS